MQKPWTFQRYLREGMKYAHNGRDTPWHTMRTLCGVWPYFDAAQRAEYREYTRELRTPFLV